jgi:hypothetical protein
MAKLKKSCHPKGKRRVNVPVCRDGAGKFKSPYAGKKTTAKKSSGKKLAKGAHCKPKSKWKNKSGNCYCRTKGGGVRPITKSACKGVRKRKAPKR